MKRPRFPGAFFVHPVFLLAMVVLLWNNLWLKPSLMMSPLAGKLSDIAIMVFLPALLCLAWEGVRYGVHTVILMLGKDKEKAATATYHPTRTVILVSIALSGAAMVALQFSETAGDIYQWVLNGFNRFFFSGRRIAEPVRDPSDLISIFFAAIPYLILRKSTPTEGRFED